MSHEEATPTETEQTNPVGTQEVPEGLIKNPRPEHKCCEHCGPDAHAPHTLGCPPAEKPSLSKEELDKLVKEAMDDMFQPRAWKPRNVVKFLIECPSGQNVLVKHMDILELAGADLVEDMDLFGKKLLPQAFDEQGRPIDEDKRSSGIWKSFKDIKKRHKFLDMTNRLMAVSSVRPKVIDDGVAIVKDEEGSETIKYGYQMTTQEQLEYFERPIPPLEGEQVYAGYVDFSDRMAFFVELQKPLGMIEPFREGPSLVLPDLESSESVGVQAE